MLWAANFVFVYLFVYHSFSLSLSLLYNYIYIYLPIFLFFLINLSYLFSLSNQSNPFAYLSSIVSIYGADDCGRLFSKMDRVCHKTNLLQALAALSTHVPQGCLQFCFAIQAMWFKSVFFIPPSRSSYLSNRSNLVYLSNLCNYLTTVSNYLLSRTKSNRSIHLFIYRFYSCLCVCDVNGLYQAITVVDTRQLRPAVDATA